MKSWTWMVGGVMGLSVALVAPVTADELDVSRTLRGNTAVQGPTRGMTMDQVLARFGEPASRMEPVGGNLPQHPPITRWVYPEFTVYFEHSMVIDAVTNAATAQQTASPPVQ